MTLWQQRLRFRGLSDLWGLALMASSQTVQMNVLVGDIIIQRNVGMASQHMTRVLGLGNVLQVPIAQKPAKMFRYKTCPIQRGDGYQNLPPQSARIGTRAAHQQRRSIG